MNKVIAIFFIFVLPLFVCAEDVIRGEKEHLSVIALGENPDQVSYSVGEDGINSPGSPFIDAEGEVVFYKTQGGRVFLVYRNGGWVALPYAGNLDDFRVAGNRFIKSQQGMLLDGLSQFVYSRGRLVEMYFSQKKISLTGSNYESFPAPWGALIFSDKQKAGIAVVFDRNNPQNGFSVIDQTKLGAWLPSQEGGFSIGQDGSVYRNGMLFSLKTVPQWGSLKFSFLGRLASGHLLWKGGGDVGSETTFTVTDQNGRIELVVKLPWEDDVENKFYRFNYGIGAWGELYALLPPKFIETHKAKNAEGGYDPVYEPDPTGAAELVVIRSYLKYFGRLNDSNVRLRIDPSTTADILGTYPAKTGFRIIEKGTKQEAIGGKADYWYHVRLLDGKEGWFFGAFVANLYDGPGTPPPWPNVADW